MAVAYASRFRFPRTRAPGARSTLDLYTLQEWANVSSNDPIVSVIPVVVGVVIVPAVRGSARKVITMVPFGVVGVTSVIIVIALVAVYIAVGVGSVIEAACVENGGICEVGGDTKYSIESVGLDTNLRRGSRRSGSTSVTSGSISLESVRELVAHKLCDNVDVLSRTVGI